jgi:hypothetical protein
MCHSINTTKAEHTKTAVTHKGVRIGQELQGPTKTHRLIGAFDRVIIWGSNQGYTVRSRGGHAIIAAWHSVCLVTYHVRGW